MNGNFKYSNPTTLYFGANSLSYLNKELQNYGKNILLIYGKGSIKKIGLYDQVISILKENNKNIFEDSGVMPNPTLDKVFEGCKIAKDNNIDLILAVGGGSVCDYAKAVSCCTYCNEDPWENYFINNKKINHKIIPIGCILTMVGTGSEMNSGSVITNTRTKIKTHSNFNNLAFPKFSILNPELTYTLPKYQMVAGFFDIMSHILEQYFSDFDDNTSDYLAEGLMKSLINSSKVAVKDSNNYEARSNIMWTATWALNGLLNKGKSTDWNVHAIGHAISAYTNATHGMTLASVSIPYYKHIMNYGLEKFKRFAINVWNVNINNKTDEQICLEGLNELEKWMKEIGLVINTTELGVTEEMIENIVNATLICDSGYKKLTSKDIKEILIKSL